MKFVLLILLSLLSILSANDLRDQAEEHLEDSEDKEALAAYQKLIETVSDDESGSDISQLVRLLKREDKTDQIDDLLQKSSKRFSANPQALLAIAEVYAKLSPEVYIQGKKVIRGRHDDFKKENIYHYNHIKKWVHLEAVRKIINDQPNTSSLKFKRDFYITYLDFLMFNTDPWMLNQLTDISELLTLTPELVTQIAVGLKNSKQHNKSYNVLLPNIEGSENTKDNQTDNQTDNQAENQRYHKKHPKPYNHRSSPRYSTENPVTFHSIPDSFKAAKNDGQRMQFIRSEAKKTHAKTSQQADFMYAMFIQLQYGEYHPTKRADNYNNNIDIETLSKLTDEQTIIKWQTIKTSKYSDKIITLPDEHNHIKIQQRLVKENFLSGVLLSNIYLTRGQNKRAVELLESIKKKKLLNAADRQHKHLSDPYFTFDTQSHSYLAGKKPTIHFKHRNVTSLELKAERIDTKRFIQDIERISHQDLNNSKTYDHTSSKELLEHAKKINLDSYLTSEVKTFKLSTKDVEPYTNHSDSLTLPLTSSGTYLLTATLEDEKTIKTIITLDTIVATVHNTKDGIQVSVLDAKTGTPLSGATVKLISLKKGNKRLLPRINDPFDDDDDYKKDPTFSTIKAITKEDGSVIIYKSRFSHNKEWIIHASHNGQHCYTKPEKLYALYTEEEHREEALKCVILTDKPIYNSGDQIHIKGIVRSPYIDNNSYTNQSYLVKISKRYHDHDNILEKIVISDNLGLFDLSAVLPSDLESGNYKISIYKKGGNNFNSAPIALTSFSVYPYIAPEYKLKISSDARSKQVSDEISININASYFHDKPVSKGQVSYSISTYKITNIPQKTINTPWSTNPWSINQYTPWYHFENKVTDQYDQRLPIIDKDLILNKDGSGIIRIPYDKYKLADSPLGIKFYIEASFTDQSNRQITEHHSFTLPGKESITYAKLDQQFGKPNKENTLTISTERANKKSIANHGTIKILKLKQASPPLKIGENPDKSQITIISEIPFKSDKTGLTTASISLKSAGNYIISIIANNAQPVHIPYCVVAKAKKALSHKGIQILAQSRIGTGEDINIELVSKIKNGTCFYQDTQLGDFIPIDIRNYHANLTLSADDIIAPNSYLRVFMVHHAKLYTDQLELSFPPEEVKLTTSASVPKQQYKPQEKATITVKVKDSSGAPVSGNVIVAIYDKALEYVDHAKAQQSLSTLWDHTHFIRPFSESSLWQNEISHNKNDNHIFSALVNKYSLSTRRGELISQRSFDDSYYDLHGQPDRAGGGATFFSMGYGGSDPFSDSGSDHDSTLVITTPEEAFKNNIRADFRSLLAWHPNLTTNANGEVAIPIQFADNLTEWRVLVWAIDEKSRYGHNQSEILVSQDLVSRPVLPRYLTERDTARISSIVHNYTDKPQDLTTSFKLIGDQLTTKDKLDITTQLKANNGESLQHWNVLAAQSGITKLQFPASIATFTDTPEKELEILPYGMLQHESTSFDLSSLKTKSYTSQRLNIPKLIDPLHNEINITYSPSIQAALQQSIPYLFNYEHGCAEQTTNRFVSAALCHQLLNRTPASQMKLTSFLADGVSITSPPALKASDITQRLKQSVNKLSSMQGYNAFSWFPGGEDNEEITNIVAYGLVRVMESGFIKNCDPQTKRKLIKITSNALNYLGKHIEGLNKGTLTNNDIESYHPFMLLTLTKARLLDEKLTRRSKTEHEEALFDFLFLNRSELSLKSLSQLALVAKYRELNTQWEILLSDVKTLHQEATAPSNEALAWVLKVHLAHDSSSNICLKLGKLILKNRDNGIYWKSTIDTAACIDALAALASSQKDNLSTEDITISLNGNKLATLSGAVMSQNPTSITLTAENSLINGNQQSVSFQSRKNLSGFGTAKISYFWQADKFTPKEKPLKIKRAYFLNQEKGKNKRLKSGDKIKVGDIINVQLTIINPDDAEYLHIKDPKPAGLVTIQKIGKHIGKHSEYYREPRLTYSNLYTDYTYEDGHIASYQLRAETVGTFTALPAEISAMYEPEKNNHTDSFVIEVIPMD